MTAPLLTQNAKYILELFEQIDFNPSLANTPNNIDRKYNIYHFSVAPLITDSTNYWIVWGGYFDNVVGYGLQVFFNAFLIEVFTDAGLKSTENSFYIDKVNDICYINIPNKPWQYIDAYSAIYSSSSTTFSTAPKNENNLSDISFGGIKAIPIMQPPELENELNEVLSGISVYNDFTIVLDNTDGRFDSLDIIKFYNTPIQISKSTDGAEDIEDFNRIRYGLVDDINVNFETVEIRGVDQMYRFDNDVCKKFTSRQFPNIGSSTVNKDMPIGWGTITKAEAFEVDRDTGDPVTWVDYIILDPDFITSCTAMYDSSGNSLTFVFDAATGIIRVTEVDGDGVVIEAEAGTVEGVAETNLGNVILSALSDGENIEYVEGIFDIVETDLYIDIAPDVNPYFKGGSTKELLEELFKNDLVFLIQKHDGLLTLRRWGETYETHYVPSWAITQAPQKNFEDATKFFCSTASVEYNKNQKDETFSLTYIDDTREREIFKENRRSYNARFECDYSAEADALDFAGRVLERFGIVRETVEIGLGVDTYQINLLDTIEIEMQINNRIFSEYSSWIVTKADPGQDIITIEGLEVTYILIVDDIPLEVDGKLLEVL